MILLLALCCRQLPFMAATPFRMLFMAGKINMGSTIQKIIGMKKISTFSYAFC